VETRLVVEAIKDMRSLKQTCRLAFEGAQTNLSATQQEVIETLRHMRLSVKDEVRCPKWGCSIDMLVNDSALEIGGERSSRGGSWAVEFDGPSHCLTSRAPTGAILLQRRHLELLGHALVRVPYWEWDGCKGAGEREQHLRGKLAGGGGKAGEKRQETGYKSASPLCFKTSGNPLMSVYGWSLALGSLSLSRCASNNSFNTNAATF
jgi:hypothetical protein